MSNIKTEAIILKGFKYGDSSKIVTLFSSEAGKFSAIVKGVRNSKSKLSGIFETLNHVSVIFNKKDNRDLQAISNADCISSYPDVKENFEKLMTAYRISELTSSMMYEYDVSKEVFILLRDVFNTLELSVNSFDLLFVMYQVKFAFIQGINPGRTEETRNFLDNKFVLRDKVYDSSRNLFEGKEINDAISELNKTEPFEFERVKMDEKLLNRLQNAYDFHFMINTGKYGHSKNRQIIDELSKKP